MNRLLLFSFFIFHFSFFANAQSPKREFRAGWIATVSNIDWPSKPGLPAAQQKQEFIDRLNELQYLGCNVVIVQIRPASDAFYDSAIEPWSRYLTGKAGRAPEPYYDPLTFMIEETHARNMEFHAWFNPFRALTDNTKNPNPEYHVTKTHKDWLVNYGGKTLLNPGIPEARSYVMDVITDVVRRYDIDAVHLDDYFYPYREGNAVFGDESTYRKYSQGFTDKEDWRRNNVNEFVKTLSQKIKAIKPYVKFGISPFGVWRNSNKDQEGSATHAGQTNYDDLYADALLWMEKGWIDYCLPQLYWEHGHHAAAFEVLLPWWEHHTYDRQIYYGLGVYRMLGNPKGAWVGTRELMSQLRDIRYKTKTPGYSFYSMSNFDKIKAPIKDSIHQFNKYTAFPPTMKWLDSIAPATPVLKLVSSNGNGTLLRWNIFNPKNEKLRYAVYRFANNEPVDIQRADKIIQLTSSTEFIDQGADKYRQCTYVVTALDRLWNESEPSNLERVKH